jgi:hypothetical protein
VDGQDGPRSRRHERCIQILLSSASRRA